MFPFPRSVSAQQECVRIWIQIRPFAVCIGRRCWRWRHHWWRRYHNTLRHWHCGHGHGGQLCSCFCFLCHWRWHIFARVHTVIGHGRRVCVSCVHLLFEMIIALRSSAHTTQIFFYLFLHALLTFVCIVCIFLDFFSCLHFVRQAANAL